MAFETSTTPTWKCTSPNGVVIGGFASERDAANKARELNSARYGNPPRHWSKRWVVAAELAVA
jgi:hypothetical protein